MSENVTHTPIEVEVMESLGCANGDCLHDESEECPTGLRDVCFECNADRQGTEDVSLWEGPVMFCGVVHNMPPLHMDRSADA